jgi:hypothetical protein
MFLKSMALPACSVFAKIPWAPEPTVVTLPLLVAGAAALPMALPAPSVTKLMPMALAPLVVTSPPLMKAMGLAVPVVIISRPISLDDTSPLPVKVSVLLLPIASAKMPVPSDATRPSF